MHIGRVIREIRKEKGISRDEAVSRSGGYFSYHSWGRLERGQRELLIKEIYKVTSILEMSSCELLDRFTRDGAINVVAQIKKNR
jgi:transcriptional regulator with XRE-family HTH domain